MSPEAQIAQLQDAARQLEGANALLRARLRIVSGAAGEAVHALEQVSYVVVGEHKRVAQVAALKLKRCVQENC